MYPIVVSMVIPMMVAVVIGVVPSTISIIIWIIIVVAKSIVPSETNAPSAVGIAVRPAEVKRWAIPTVVVVMIIPTIGPSRNCIGIVPIYINIPVVVVVIDYFTVKR